MQEFARFGSPAPGCREWTEDSQLWVQYVSSTPATRLDVITLQEKLDQQLQQRQVCTCALCFFVFSVLQAVLWALLFYHLGMCIGKRNWHLSCQRRALCSVLRRTDKRGHDQLC